MRLSEWRSHAPRRESMSSTVTAAVQSVLSVLGAGPDPECWIAWGDDPAVRYVVLVPTQAGLVSVSVRVNVPGEGPRAAGKVTRWPRVQIGELAIETQAQHRILSFQLEGQVLRGVDAEADAIAAFVLTVFAAQDGRPVPVSPKPRRAARAGAVRDGAGNGGKKPGTRQPASNGSGSRGRPPIAGLGAATGDTPPATTTRRRSAGR